MTEANIRNSGGAADDVETPAVLIDLDIFERNLDRMAAYTSAHRLSLRPHVKTHKAPAVARQQLGRGAVGLTCATVTELEVMAAVTDDLLFAYPPVGPRRLLRLEAVAKRRRLTVTVESQEAIDALAMVACSAKQRVRVLLEINVGMHRTGVAGVHEAVALARYAAERSELEYAGIAYYPGHIRQHVQSQDAQFETLNSHLETLVAALGTAGLAPGMVSGGSTPTVWRTHELAGTTEIRPGTYVYNDVTTAAIGACAWTDCAATIVTTVVSTAVGQAVVDAGTKALGREPIRGVAQDGFGVVIDHPEVTVARMSEEHGVLDLGSTSWRPSIGDRVRIIPNHVCVAMHLYDSVHAVRDGNVTAVWPVAARGRL